LCGCEASACDLTQQTFFLWATKGHQLKDPSRVKAWLFTTLRREFLNARRHSKSHPHVELEVAGPELPEVQPEVVSHASVAEVLRAFEQLDDLYRLPLTLFHIESHSYKEIAECLEMPIGSVMSRISRGRQKVFQILEAQSTQDGEPSVIPFERRRTV